MLELLDACRGESALPWRVRAVQRSACGNRRIGACRFMRLPSRLKWLWLTLGMVLADRATKAWFEAQTNESWRHEVVRHFIYLVHSRNPGIAFSFFADSHSPWLRVLLIGGALAVICALAWLLVAGQGGVAACAGLALLLGGATGNVTDRIIHGAVT